MSFWLVFLKMLTLYLMIIMEAENSHGFFFFFITLLSRDNDLLSHYLDITNIVFS